MLPSSRSTIEHHNHAQVVGAPVIECSLHQHSAYLHWMRFGRTNDLLYLGITHHFPQAIRTQQQDITSAQLDNKRIYLHRRMSAQVALKHFVVWMCVDVFRCDGALFQEPGSSGMILRNL